MSDKLFIIVFIVIAASLEVDGVSTMICTRYCEGSQCSPINVTRLDEAVCACRKYMLMNNPREHKKLWITSHDNSSVIIRWKKKNQPDGGSAMLCVSNTAEDTCFMVTLEETTADQSLKVSCRGYQTASKVTLSDVSIGRHWEVIASGSLKKVGRRKSSWGRTIRSAFQPCSCWIPNRIALQQVSNNSIRIMWFPFPGPKSIRVRLPFSLGDDIIDETTRDELLKPLNLCEQELKEYTFHNLKPNRRYVAEVGEFGGACECSSYKVSDELILMPVQTTTTTALDFHTPVHRKISSGIASRYGLDLTSCIVIGIACFIGLVVLGLLVYYKIHKHRLSDTKYPDLPVELMPLYPQICLTTESNDQGISECLYLLKTHFERNDIKVSLSNTNSGDLKVDISLRDINALDGQTWSYLNDDAVSVLVDYTFSEQELRFRLPQGFQNRLLRGLPNNIGSMDKTFTLGDFTTLLQPGRDVFGCLDTLESASSVLTATRDRLVNILLISGCDHPHHTRACFELCDIIRKLGKTVSYIYDPDVRREVQRDGVIVWTQNKMKKADVVLIVSSNILFRLVKWYNRDMDASESVLNESLCAPLALKLLSQQLYSPKVICISFGYMSTCINDISKICPMVDFRVRYDLIGRRAESRLIGDNQQSLTVLLCRLCSDMNLVTEACDASDSFYAHVDGMAVIVKQSGWLQDTLGSVESIQSIWTLSNKSITYECRQEVT